MKNCKKCITQEWCICASIREIYNKTMFNKKRCLCCYERARVIEESSRTTNESTRQQMKKLAAGMLQFYKQTIFNAKDHAKTNDHE